MDNPLTEKEEETERAYQVLMAAYQEAVREEDRLAVLFGKALTQLFEEHARWQQNYFRYRGWDRDHRINWIYYIQEQAEQGLPMAQQVMAKALAIRMAS